MRVEVWYRPEFGDGRAQRLAGARRVSMRDVYIVNGVPGLQSAELATLVSDRIAQEVEVVADGDTATTQPEDFGWRLLVEVSYKPGVSDPVAVTLRTAIADVLGRRVPANAVVQTAQQYRFADSADPPLGLYNPLIQAVSAITAAQWRDGERPPAAYAPTPVAVAAGGRVERFDLVALDAEQLAALSADRLLALSAEELAAIAAYYDRPAVRRRREAAGIGANATDVELEMLAQTWSEHCKHKIFNATIEYDNDGELRTIKSLFDTYIRATTAAVAPDDFFLRSVFHDNSGVIEFDEQHLVCFKVETHNSPSALDPYGGAITGIVGVNRDILGTGRGARPIFNTNVLCFAPPATPNPPIGVIPPRQMMQGVHRGIVDGGNQSGIPVAGGGFLFDQSFIGKPLVFCGTGGLMPALIDGEPAWEAHPQAGDRAVMVGGRIGKDGIHGATFSSLALDDTAPLSAVQIGDPIMQKRMSDFLLEARDRRLYRALTDNGAGGLSSSFGEMARECGGVRLRLDRAPLKYPGLAPWEILLSEAQERMSLAVPSSDWDAFSLLAEQRDVEVSDIGEFTDAGEVAVFYEERLVARLDLDFLHGGLPEMRLRATWPGAAAAASYGRSPAAATQEPATADAWRASLLRLLADPNIASKEELVRQYDHEVQAESVIKPFVGLEADGPSDGAVLRPVPDSARGLTVTHGICPWFSSIDTYDMARCAVDEAVRGHVACGGDPDRMTALDNFCWPDPIEAADNPDGRYKLAQLVRAMEGLSEACRAYRLPLISGKDSMKNDAWVDGRKISVLPTLLISLMGIIPDVAHAIGTDFLQPGHALFVVGKDRHQLGASSYARMMGLEHAAVPTATPEHSLPLYQALHRAMRAGRVASAHDLADGGLAVAVAESAIGGRLGAWVDLAAVPRESPPGPGSATGGVSPTTAALFSETAGRLLVSVPAAHVAAFGAEFPPDAVAHVGEVIAEPEISFVDADVPVMSVDLGDVVAAWKTPI